MYGEYVDYFFQLKDKELSYKELPTHALNKEVKHLNTYKKNIFVFIIELR